MDKATQKHAQRFYASRKTLDRNIEIIQQLLSGKDREEVAVNFSLSKTQISWIGDKMMRDMGHHIRWLNVEHPWPREKYPNGYFHNRAINEYAFVPSKLTIDQLRVEKEFVMKILINLQGLVWGYVAFRESQHP